MIRRIFVTALVFFAASLEIDLDRAQAGRGGFFRRARSTRTTNYRVKNYRFRNYRTTSISRSSNRPARLHETHSRSAILDGFFGPGTQGHASVTPGHRAQCRPEGPLPVVQRRACPDRQPNKHRHSGSDTLLPVTQANRPRVPAASSQAPTPRMPGLFLGIAGGCPPRDCCADSNHDETVG